MRSYNATTLGEYVVYNCVDGYYYVNGSTTKVCETDGEWSQTEAMICVQKECHPPDTIKHGWFLPQKTSYIPGDVITFYCEDNFLMMKNTTSICDDAGSWTVNQQVCKPILCPADIFDGDLLFNFRV